MSNWETKILNDICSLSYGKNLPTADLISDGFPVYGANSVIGYHSKFNIEFRTVLVSCRGEYSGTINITKGKAFVTNNSIPLKIITNTIDTIFLYYSLTQVPSSKIVSGSAQPQVTINDLKKINIPIPPLPQQRKIAKILTTVDNLIEKTESLIAKYQSIKQGMMHDLFTRGVDAKGKLRPPQSEAPELYKQSELGWIPKEWEVALLETEITPIKGGWSPVCDSSPSGIDEWGILKTTAVVWDGYEEMENKRLPTDLTPILDLEVKKDDILITRKGPMERVGVIVHVQKTRPKLIFPDTIFKIRVLPDRSIIAAFLPLVLGSSFVQEKWRGQKIGLAEAQVDINHKILKQTSFSKPKMHEQKQIIEKHIASNSHILLLNKELKVLKNLKIALMQDLLTGKVQVTPDAEDKELAHA